MTTTRTTAAEAAATTSAPDESFDEGGRPGRGVAVNGAAAARTEELYTLYRRTVSGLCRALLRDRAEAEDAAQQTFLSAHRALLAGTDPREPAAWLAAIARNECWARIRGRMREPLPAGELETASGRHDPLEEAIRRADLAALWRAVEELPQSQRDALLLREFGGLSYEELAAALAVSGPAVESLLFRARQRLRLRLRAAYASLGGAPLLETLARLLGGAPVAAKLAALGVGAATVTGSAVVVPQVLEGGSRAVRPAQADLPRRQPGTTHRTAVPAATPAAALVRPATRAPERATSGHDGSATPESTGARHDGGDLEPAVEPRRDGREGAAGTPAPSEAKQPEAEQRDGGEAAATTVQAELQPVLVATDGHEGDGGGDGGPDGGSDGVG